MFDRFINSLSIVPRGILRRNINCKSCKRVRVVLRVRLFFRLCKSFAESVCHLFRHLWRGLEFVLLLIFWSSLCVSTYYE